MVCYSVPIAAALVIYVARKLRWKGGEKGYWLNLMLLGASIFGGIDHAWNGELFMIGSNIASDIALGFTITAGTFASWAIIAYKDKIESSLLNLESIMGFQRKQA